MFFVFSCVDIYSWIRLDFAGKECSFRIPKPTISQPNVSIFMAKKNTILLKLVSTAGTGFYYVKKRNPKKQTEKLALKKYDPVVRKHVEFKEQKLK